MRNKLPGSITILLLLLLSTASQAEEVIFDSGYSEVMQNNVSNMQDILFGIMVEDYKQVENIAEDIAYQPGPDLEKRLALLQKLEMEAVTFKLHEDKVRQNALKLMKAAEKKDRLEVLEKFSTLATSCTECHIGYREKVRSFQKGR